MSLTQEREEEKVNTLLVVAFLAQAFARSAELIRRQCLQYRNTWDGHEYCSAPDQQ